MVASSTLSLAHSCLLVYAIDMPSICHRHAIDMPLMTTDPGRAGKVLDGDLVWDLG